MFGGKITNPGFSVVDDSLPWIFNVDDCTIKKQDQTKLLYAGDICEQYDEFRGINNKLYSLDAVNNQSIMTHPGKVVALVSDRING